jgi:putative ABC transport system substrate-binding protein
MRRRDFIALVGSVPRVAAGGVPPSATKQIIGFLDSRSHDLIPNLLRAFREGLKETGYAEGENVTIEYRWAEDQNDQLPALAADLVRQQVTVIAAAPTHSSPAELKSLALWRSATECQRSTNIPNSQRRGA